MPAQLSADEAASHYGQLMEVSSLELPEAVVKDMHTMARALATPAAYTRLLHYGRLSPNLGDDGWRKKHGSLTYPQLVDCVLTEAEAVAGPLLVNAVCLLLSLNLEPGLELDDIMQVASCVDAVVEEQVGLLSWCWQHARLVFRIWNLSFLSFLSRGDVPLV
jgi:hypothetical protein